MISQSHLFSKLSVLFIADATGDTRQGAPAAASRGLFLSLLLLYFVVVVVVLTPLLIDCCQAKRERQSQRAKLREKHGEAMVPKEVR